MIEGLCPPSSSLIKSERPCVTDTASEAYFNALWNVRYFPQFRSSPRGLPVLETMNYTFVVRKPDTNPIVTQDLERNKVIADYTAKETELYNTCTNQAEDFAKASKFWNKIKNPDGTINSAYGYLIWKKKSCGNHLMEMSTNGWERVPAFSGNPAFISEKDSCYRTPWEWAKESLIADKDTRQAVMHFNLPEHAWVGNKDFVCTMYANFLIRDDKLHLTVTMRSNDLMLGLVYDLSWFMSLIFKMIDELRTTYPSLEVGTYTHIANSMHIYEKDLPVVERMLGH